MSAIGPGDWVECVDASPCRRIGFTSLVHGRLYRVSALGVPDGSGERGLIIAEAPHPDTTRYGVGWALRRFRPVYRPRAHLIESLLKPVDGVKPRVDA